MSATNTLSAAQALPLISQYESGNQNVLNTQGSTASGYYQIINGTWQQFAPQAGVSLTQYPTAMSAPQAVQTQVATTIYNAQGFGPWSSNANLLAAVQNQTGSPAVSDSTGPTIDVGGATPTPTVNTAGSGSGSGSWFAPVWNYLSRGILLAAGLVLVFIAVVALLWSAKSTPVFGADLAGNGGPGGGGGGRGPGPGEVGGTVKGATKIAAEAAI